MDLLDPGVSRVLADDRARRLGVLQCELHLALPRDPAAPIEGRIAWSFTLDAASAPLVFDFAPEHGLPPQAAVANGHPMDVVSRQGHLVVPADALRTGHNRVEFSFTAGNLPLNRRSDHLYSIFVPARAHQVLPCFDQPSLRAVWRLTLDMPGDWRAVSNAPMAEQRVALDGSRVIVRFADTRPLPTYLFAFAAGLFEDARVQRDGRAIGVWHTGVDAALVADNLDALAAGHVEALRWMEDYTAIPHPFDKLDIVLLPAFQFGGMEHPGAIFYNAQVVLLGAGATRQQQLARANVIAHETAHLWFGDLVTMRWFDDVWMKEVFANFMAARIVNPQFEDLDHDLRFLHQHYPSAYDVDRTSGSNPIRQPLDNLGDAGSLYGPIVYLKSPIVMRQLERQIGADALQAALRAYLARHAFGCADWPDLLEALTAHAAMPLDQWSRDWIDAPGRPTVRVDLEVDAGLIRRLRVSTTPDQGQARHPRRWPQPIRVLVSRDGAEQQVEGWLDNVLDVPGATGAHTPDFVLPNGGGLLYADARLDATSRAYLAAHLPQVGPALTRGAAWLALWDAMIAGDIDAGAMLDLALRLLPVETDDLNRQRVLADLERLFWIWCDDEVRVGRAGDVERTLRALLEAPHAAPVKTAVLATLRHVTSTDEGCAWLHAIWSGAVPVQGLSLGDADAVALALELAVRRSDGAAIVAGQLSRTRDRDRREALAFVAPAVSHDATVRAQAFERLRDVAQRRREPWVVETVRWLHHPVRATAAVALIRPGLDLLEEIRRTGDIFLPKRWTDAMLAGHRSQEAAMAVSTFVGSLRADYPDALRRIIAIASHHLSARGLVHLDRTPRA